MVQISLVSWFGNHDNVSLILVLKFSLSSLVHANICGFLLNFVTFVRFQKREKHPWKSVTFSKIAG